MHDELKKILLSQNINSFCFVDAGAKDKIESIPEINELLEIHAFEPNPQEFKKLQNKYLSHPFQQLKINNTALHSYLGKSDFNIAQRASMSSLLLPDHSNYKKNFGNYSHYNSWENNISTAKTIHVDLETLDNYFNDKQTSIDYLKIDTQGSELSILKGGEGLLKQKRIRVIKVEVSMVPVYKDQALFADIDTYLRSHRFALVDFINYPSNYQPLFSKSKVEHIAPCGDAVYYLDNSNSSKGDKLKIAIVLWWLGYKSLTKSLLKGGDFNENVHNGIDRIRAINENSFLKKILKSLVPPIVLQVLKGGKV